MNENPVRKLYRSIAVTWAIAMIWALALGYPRVAFSITLGMSLGTLVVASFHWLSRRAFVPGSVRPKRALLGLATVKYPLMGLALYYLVRSDAVSLPAFAGGVALVHFAILAKMLGIRLIESNAERSAPCDALLDHGEI